MESPLPASPLRGRLLVANPLLTDPNFDRSVVLVLAHGGEGALGVILNRPSDTGVDEILPRWAPLAATPGVLYSGGPVNRRAVIGVAGRDAGAVGARAGEGEQVRAWTAVSENLGTVDLELEPEQVPVERVRIFIGYAGWSAGQLEGEIAGGSWWVVDALPEDTFASRPERLWRDVLRRQGQPLAYVGSFPPDPKMN